MGTYCVLIAAVRETHFKMALLSIGMHAYDPIGARQRQEHKKVKATWAILDPVTNSFVSPSIAKLLFRKVASFSILPAAHERGPSHFEFILSF